MAPSLRAHLRRPHRCNRAGSGREWMMCSACDGRIHISGCTAKRDKARDCCVARHKALHDAGETLGRHDSSLTMWTPEDKDYA